MDIAEWYQKLGYPQAQIDIIARQGWFSASFMLWACSSWAPLVLGYLLWLKRYFLATP